MKWKWMRMAAVALLVPAFTACSDDSTDPDGHADEVANVRLAIGTNNITMNPAGTVSGGTITLTRNTATPIAATFLNASGGTITLGNEFRLELTTTGGITFARTGNFAGTLTGATAGTGTVQVCVLHIAENHCDFGSNTGTGHRFNVTVQ